MQRGAQSVQAYPGVCEVDLLVEPRHGDAGYELYSGMVLDGSMVRLAGLATEYEGELYNKYLTVTSIDLESGEEGRVDMLIEGGGEEQTDGYIQNLAMGRTGKVLVLREAFSSDSPTDYTISQWQVEENGGLDWELHLAEELGQNIYVQEIFSGENGNWYVVFSDTRLHLAIINENGEMVEEFSVGRSRDYDAFRQVLQNDQGQLVFHFYNEDEDRGEMRLLAMDSRSLGDPILLDGGYYAACNGGEWGMVVNEYGVHSIRSDGSVELIVDTVLSAHRVGAATQWIDMGDGQGLLLYSPYFNYEGDGWISAEALGRFRPEDGSVSRGRQVLTLAKDYMEDYILDIMLEFNSSNEKYMVKPLILMEEFWDAHYQYRQLEFAEKYSGKGEVDIFVSDSTVSAEALFPMGELEDLYAYMQADEEIASREYAENVFRAFSTEGKLYSLPSHVTIQTGAVQKDWLAPGGWTVEEAMALMEGLPQGTIFATSATLSDWGHDFMSSASHAYIDWSKKEAYFDSPEFIQQLEFLKYFADSDTISAMLEEASWEKLPIFNSGRAVWMSAAVYTPEDWFTLRHSVFGKEFTWAGMPGRVASVGSFSAESCYSIFSDSKHKEGAWEFVRQVLLPEFQEEALWSMPVLEESLDALVMKCMEDPGYMEDGSWVSFVRSAYFNEDWQEIPNMTLEEAESFLDFYHSVEHRMVWNYPVIEIINVESMEYIEGRADARTAAANIQAQVEELLEEYR